MTFWVEILAGKSCQRKSNERNTNLKREEKRYSHLMFNEWVDQSRFSYLFVTCQHTFSLSFQFMLILSFLCHLSKFFLKSRKYYIKRNNNYDWRIAKDFGTKNVCLKSCFLDWVQLSTLTLESIQKSLSWICPKVIPITVQHTCLVTKCQY